jgi:hypothetical protein
MVNCLSSVKRDLALTLNVYVVSLETESAVPDQVPFSFNVKPLGRAPDIKVKVTFKPDSEVADSGVSAEDA